MIKEKRIQIQLTTKEPLRIGGKEDPISVIHNPVTKVGGKLVIPGSSLKGALRAEIERFLIDAFYANGKWKDGFEDFKPCIPGAELSKDEENLVDAGKYVDYRSPRDKVGACHYPCKDKCSDTNHQICPACYLLGCMGLNGFVKVPFLYTDTSTSELYSSRIDRATKTVPNIKGAGANRPYELVPDGAKFKGTLSVLLEDTILNWKLGEKRNLGEARTHGDKWLETNNKTQDEFVKTYIIDRLKAVNVLGGYKSKGFGAVEISVSFE